MSNARDDTWTVARSAEEIEDAIQKLGREISLDYVGRQPLVLLTTARLSSVLFFFGALGRAINPAIRFKMAMVDIVEQDGERRLVYIDGVEKLIPGAHIIIARPLMTTGLTMAFMKQELLEAGAKSVKTCVLLNKTWRESVIQADYVGFHATSSVYMAGYGLDDGTGKGRLLDHLVKSDDPKATRKGS
jgi:hypoxanthine phosphoribosyltransferase